MDKPLSNRIALITGASRGIGAATALALGKAGAHVVAIARTTGGLEELDDQIRSAGGTATLVPLDITDTGGIARLATALDQRYGRLDVLIGNAAIVGNTSPLGHVEPKSWDQVMAINVTANWHLIRFLDPLRPQFTDHCFTGDYPTPLTDQTGQDASPRQLSLLAEAS